MLSSCRRIYHLWKPLIPVKRTRYYLDQEKDPGVEAVKLNDLMYFDYLDQSGYCFSKAVLTRIILHRRKEFLRHSSLRPLSKLHLEACLRALVHTGDAGMMKIFETQNAKSSSNRSYETIVVDRNYERARTLGYTFGYNILRSNGILPILYLSFNNKIEKYDGHGVRYCLESGDFEIIQSLLSQLSFEQFKSSYHRFHLELDFATMKQVVETYSPDCISLTKLIIWAFYHRVEYTIKDVFENGWRPDQEFGQFHISLIRLFDPRLNDKLKELQTIVAKYFSEEDSQKIIKKLTPHQ